MIASKKNLQLSSPMAYSSEGGIHRHTQRKLHYIFFVVDLEQVKQIKSFKQNKNYKNWSDAC